MTTKNISRPIQQRKKKEEKTTRSCFTLIMMNLEKCMQTLRSKGETTCNTTYNWLK